MCIEFVLQVLKQKNKRGWREGVGDKQTLKKSPKSFPEICPLLLRGHRKKGTERVQKRGLNIWPLKGFLAPTPSVRQPLFETSENKKRIVLDIVIAFS